MATVKVSPKYQVVIPRDVRESLGLRSGEKVDRAHAEAAARRDRLLAE